MNSKRACPRYKVSFEVSDCWLSAAGLQSMIQHSIARKLSPPYYDDRIEEASAVISKLKIEEIE